MARVNPSSSVSPPPSSEQVSSVETEFFTIWMKSLILNGNGCTIYNSKGQIVYRVDNYDCKCRGSVYLMDPGGKALLKILTKKCHVFETWEGFKYCSDSQQEQVLRPWFKVKKRCTILKFGHSYCEVVVGASHVIAYKMGKVSSKSEYKILDISGKVVAEVSRKLTASGVTLGDDVLTLMVQPHVDHSFIMGLVIVHGLMNCIL